jgi:transposase-like protein
MTKAAKPRTFADDFKDRITKLERDALDAGLNLTEVCRQAGVSRATPDRWRRKTPKTISLVSRMEQIVAREIAKQARSTGG